jgi:hypothetical protein
MPFSAFTLLFGAQGSAATLSMASRMSLAFAGCIRRRAFRADLAIRICIGRSSHKANLSATTFGPLALAEYHEQVKMLADAHGDFMTVAITSRPWTWSAFLNPPDIASKTDAMNLMLRIPDRLAKRLGAAGELERRALEALALEEFRLGRLTRYEVRELLGFATRGELDAFLAAHGIFGSYAQADLERDQRDLQRLGH